MGTIVVPPLFYLERGLLDPVVARPANDLDLGYA